MIRVEPSGGKGYLKDLGAKSPRMIICCVAPFRPREARLMQNDHLLKNGISRGKERKREITSLIGILAIINMKKTR